MYRIVVLFLILLVVGLSLSSCQEVHAQFYNPCRVRTYAPVYHAPYVAPTYVEPYKPEVVLKAVKVQVQPDYYYSVSDSYRDALLADAIAFRVLLAQKLGKETPSSVPRYKEPAVPGKVDSPPPMSPAPAEAPAVPANLTTVLNNRCVKCHAGGANGIDLSNPSLVPAGQRWHAYGLANSGEMPKGQTPIPDAEVRTLYEWAKSSGKK